MTILLIFIFLRASIAQRGVWVHCSCSCLIMNVSLLVNVSELDACYDREPGIREQSTNDAEMVESPAIASIGAKVSH